MHEFALDLGSCTLPPSGYQDWALVRRALEDSAPTLTTVVGAEQLLADPHHWRGVYAVPNCPDVVDAPHAVAAYCAAVRRYGGKADKVVLTKAVTTKLAPFLAKFTAKGGVSLYHWAFVRVHALTEAKHFVCQRNSNAGLNLIFAEKELSPWRLHQMFRQFPSGKVVCLRTVEAALNYKSRQSQVLAEAMRVTLATNHVQTGIDYVQAKLPQDELRGLATLWRNTAKAVEASLSSRIAAGEDIWGGLFPGLEK